jgi:hypothetical protein
MPERLDAGADRVRAREIGRSAHAATTSSASNTLAA